MNREVFLSELSAQLQCRGVDKDRIGEIVAEVETHLDDSGESPVDAFGPAVRYAEEMAVFAESNTNQRQEEKWHHRTFRATALDEMQILKWAGKDGWELLDVGAYALFCRRPADMSQSPCWEYKRRTGTNHRKILEEMTDEQWTPCGNWVVFHYFKRKVEGGHPLTA